MSPIAEQNQGESLPGPEIVTWPLEGVVSKYFNRTPAFTRQGVLVTVLQEDKNYPVFKKHVWERGVWSTFAGFGSYEQRLNRAISVAQDMAGTLAVRGATSDELENYNRGLAF